MLNLVGKQSSIAIYIISTIIILILFITLGPGIYEFSSGYKAIVVKKIECIPYAGADSIAVNDPYTLAYIITSTFSDNGIKTITNEEKQKILHNYLISPWQIIYYEDTKGNLMNLDRVGYNFFAKTKLGDVIEKKPFSNIIKKVENEHYTLKEWADKYFKEYKDYKGTFPYYRHLGRGIFSVNYKNEYDLINKHKQLFAVDPKKFPKKYYSYQTKKYYKTMPIPRNASYYEQYSDDDYYYHRRYYHRSYYHRSYYGGGYSSYSRGSSYRGGGFGFGK